MVSLILGIATVITLLIGIPVAFCLGIGALAAVMYMGDIPLQLIPQKLFKGMDSFPLLCIPFFIFAGDLMSQGKITEKILKFAVILVRTRPGRAGYGQCACKHVFWGDDRLCYCRYKRFRLS